MPVHIPIGSQLEERMAQLIAWAKLPEPERQFRFCPPRRWRFDFAWPTAKVALEVDGERSHARYHQTTRDAIKRNRAVVLGWRVLTATGTMISQDPGSLLEDLREVLCQTEKSLGMPSTDNA